MAYKLKLKNETSGEIRRIGLDELSFNGLETLVKNLFGDEGNAVADRDYKFKYVDEEGDEIVISSDEELRAAYDAVVKDGQKSQSQTLVISISTKIRTQSNKTPLVETPQNPSLPSPQNTAPQFFHVPPPPPPPYFFPHAHPHSQSQPGFNHPHPHPQPHHHQHHPYHHHPHSQGNFAQHQAPPFWFFQGMGLEHLLAQFFAYAEVPAQMGFQRLNCGFRNGIHRMTRCKFSFFRGLKMLFFLFLFAFVVLPIAFHTLSLVVGILGYVVKMVWYWALIKLAFVALRTGTQCMHRRVALT